MQRVGRIAKSFGATVHAVLAGAKQSAFAQDGKEYSGVVRSWDRATWSIKDCTGGSWAIHFFDAGIP